MSKSAKVWDDWSANPYPVTDPRHDELEAVRRMRRRDKLMGTIRPETLRLLRTSDFVQEHVTIGARHDNSSVVPKAQHPFPSRLREPESHVERTVHEESLTCHMVTDGGSLSWSGLRDGSIVIRNGFTAHRITTLNVSDEILPDDATLKHQEQNRDTQNPTLNKGLPAATSTTEKLNKTRYPVAISMIGSSMYAAVFLSDQCVRIYDTVPLVAVTELKLESRETSVGSTSDESKVAAAKADQGPTSPTLFQPEGQVPFAYIFTINATGNPLVFGILQARTLHLLSLTFQADDINEQRPVLEVTNFRSYAKLNLSFISASVDLSLHTVYVGDTAGKVWWLDLEDLLVIDSLDIVDKRKRKQGAPSEVASAVSLIHDFIIVGSNTGRVVAFQKTPYHGRPVPVLNSVGAHTARVVSLYPDERRPEGFWSISNDGTISFWSLISFGQLFHAQAPIAGPVGNCAVVPHTVVAKMWSLTTSGVNNVWLSESNSSHEEMKIRVDTIQDLLQRHRTIASENNGIQSHEEQVLRQKTGLIVKNMELNALKRTLRHFYYSWLKYRFGAIAKRNRAVNAASLANVRQRSHQRMYYQRWCMGASERRGRKQTSAMLNYLRLRCEDTLLKQFYDKWQGFVGDTKNAKRNVGIANFARDANESYLLVTYFNYYWRRFIDMKRHDRFLTRIASTSSRSAEILRMSTFYNIWYRLFSQIREQKRRVTAVTSMANSEKRSLGRRYLYKWRLFNSIGRRDTLRKQWVGGHAVTAMLSLQRRCFNRLQENMMFKRCQKVEREITLTSIKHAEVSRSHVQVAGIGHRLRRIEKLKAQLSMAKEETASYNSDAKLVSSHIRELRDQAAKKPKVPVVPPPKEDGEEDELNLSIGTTEEPVLVKLNNLISALRTACINYQTDYELIDSLHDKGTRVLFRGALLLLKDALSRVQFPIGDKYMPNSFHSANEFPNGADWNLGHDELAVHQRIISLSREDQKKAFSNMKKLVIAYDGLSTKALAKLTNVEELLHNGDALVAAGEFLTQLK